jgi:hypothetical protein
MPKSNYEQIRRVRHEMSEKCGHDPKKLIDMINELTKDHSHKIISPGTIAEHCNRPATPTTDFAPVTSTPVSG